MERTALCPRRATGRTGAHKKGIVHDGVPNHRRLAFFLGSENEVYACTPRDQTKLQPKIPSIAKFKHCLRLHGGVRTESLPVYADRIVQVPLKKGKIEKRVDLLESDCFQTKASFKAKY